MSQTTAARPRPEWVTTLIITVASLILAFLVSAVVMVVSDAEVAATWTYFFAQPGDALSASWDKISSTLYAMYVGSLGSWVAITNTTAEAAPLDKSHPSAQLPGHQGRLVAARSATDDHHVRHTRILPRFPPPRFGAGAAVGASAKARQ